MNASEQIEIARYQETAEADLPRLDARRILMDGYHRCTRVAAALKLLRAIDYLRNPERYELHALMLRDHRRRARRNPIRRVDMSFAPQHTK